MAFDVVTAKQGKPHVTADQQALMQAGMMGKGRYALDALNNLACTMTDSNTLTVDTVGLMVDGRWVVNEAQTSFAIANGSQAQFRKDLAVLEITVDPSTGVTSLEEKVLQGATAATEAAAADPTYEPGDLYTGLTAVVPIARITLIGLTPTCKALLPSVADLKTISEQTKKLGDSVSQTAARVPGKMFVGSVVSTVDSSSTASGHEARLFREEEFTEKFGRSFDSSKDYIGVMNGDGRAANAYLDSATYFPATGNIWVGVPGVSNGNAIRLNYLVVLGD